MNLLQIQYVLCKHLCFRLLAIPHVSYSTIPSKGHSNCWSLSWVSLSSHSVTTPHAGQVHRLIPFRDSRGYLCLILATGNKDLLCLLLHSTAGFWCFVTLDWRLNITIKTPDYSSLPPDPDCSIWRRQWASVHRVPECNRLGRKPVPSQHCRPKGALCATVEIN